MRIRIDTMRIRPETTFRIRTHAETVSESAFMIMPRAYVRALYVSLSASSRAAAAAESQAEEDEEELSIGREAVAAGRCEEAVVVVVT